MFKMTKRELIMIMIIILGMALFIGNKYIKKEWNEPTIQLENEEVEIEKEDLVTQKKKEEVNEEWIMVDVCGEVNNPGVVKLKTGQRVVHAIEQAGGLKDIADRKLVNMARVLLDGEQLYIPKKGENLENPMTTEIMNPSSNRSGKVNINRASGKELESLDGIGKVLGERIFQYRKEHGVFKDIKDIMKVSGIGESKFNAIKDHISIN